MCPVFSRGSQRSGEGLNLEAGAHVYSSNQKPTDDASFAIQNTTSIQCANLFTGVSTRLRMLFQLFWELIMWKEVAERRCIHAALLQAQLAS